LTRLSPEHLDAILALQLTVAWAGESAGEPARLGWWKSDLVDPEGGGDLMARLAPKTARWASLGLVREAAREVDRSLRTKAARGDRLWTLFHFGFEIDEQLDDRLAYHRQHQTPPDLLLQKIIAAREDFLEGGRAESEGSEGRGGTERFIVGKPFSSQSLERWLSELGSPKVETTPTGRKLDARPGSPVEAAQALAAALRPLGATYALPYIEVPR
jgi:hypothetical protein